MDLKHVARPRSKTFKVQQNFTSFFRDLLDNEQSRNQFIQSIIMTGFASCVLEFPELIAAGLGLSVGLEHDSRQAEYTVAESPPFHRASWVNFADKLRYRLGGPETVTSFMNLAGDTLLIVPIPTCNPRIDQHSGHLMDFLKHGQRNQVHHLIQEMSARVLSRAAETRHAGERMYLSTHGYGVPWLHIRICTHPKYFVTREYEQQSSRVCLASSGRCVFQRNRPAKNPVGKHGATYRAQVSFVCSRYGTCALSLMFPLFIEHLNC